MEEVVDDIALSSAMMCTGGDLLKGDLCAAEASLNTELIKTFIDGSVPETCPVTNLPIPFVSFEYGQTEGGPRWGKINVKLLI